MKVKMVGKRKGFTGVWKKKEYMYMKCHNKAHYYINDSNACQSKL